MPKKSARESLKAGLHLRALRSLFFEQSFHAIGQEKNEAILLAWSDVTIARLKKKLKYIQLFSKRALLFYDVIFSQIKNDWSQSCDRSAHKWRPTISYVVLCWISLTLFQKLFYTFRFQLKCTGYRVLKLKLNSLHQVARWLQWANSKMVSSQLHWRNSHQRKSPSCTIRGIIIWTECLKMLGWLG